MAEWKLIEGFNNYEIGNDGSVRVVKTGKILKQQTDTGGYKMLHLANGTKKHIAFRIHRLVAKSFLLNENNFPEVNHISGNKSDNNIENLEYCTPHENMKHAYGTLKRKVCPPMLGKFGADNCLSKPICQYTKTGELINTYPSLSDAAKSINKRGSCISNSMNPKLRGSFAYGFRWEYV